MRKISIIIICVAILVITILPVLLWRFYFTENNKNYLNISGIVLPHHDLVAEARADFLSDLAGKIKKPETIILISPNHYSTGIGDIQVTDKNWNLANGKIDPDNTAVDYLSKEKIASVESASFANEHGIYNILSDIHKNFPDAKLVPIIIKQKVGLGKMQNLEKGLLQTCINCLMIASVDFSHYQPALLSDLHDADSIRYLQNLDAKNLINNAEVDSGQSLALLALWARDHSTFRFNIQDHTSSDVIFKKPDAEGTTHVFGYYQEGQKILSDKEVSFIFAGDAMFTRGITYRFKNDYNKAFANFGDRVFWGTDAKVLNLEGAITKDKIKFQAHTMNFQFPPEIAKTLNYLHINAVSLANNHSDNAGQNGYDTTKEVLGQNNIQDFGYANYLGILRVAEFEGQGIKLVIIGVNLTYPGQSADPVVDIIKKYKNSDTKIIVMPHWGNEYESKHNKFQQNSAHLWIDAGANMVIGSHPHVIQDAELYKEKPIFYSLGNFLFDQTFSGATQQGIIIAGKFTDKGLEFFILPHKSVDTKPQLMTGQEKSKILSSLYKPFADYLENTPSGGIIKIKN